ncbi:B12-binding domain-containing radical SAM protein [Candidatus Aalborgicola defluviihabitans]|uniref:B12-binding domain-containing radical SAM protein n=1 Tax=Candidatus Aalborgicola defluviihabitans TaxID=3386187 RepID=UPI0039099879|nr:radical SAM protein [Burkholderiales bacterium]
MSFDDIPVPAYDRDLLKRLESPVISVTQARGCYWGRCSYCDFIELYEGNPSYRGRRVESFVDEIEQQIAAHSIRNYSFVTESIPPSFARKVSSEILRRDVKITWSSFVMVDHRFDEELFRLMRQSGCQRLIVGTESMVDRVLKLVEKAGTVRENIRFMRSAKGASLNC